VTAPLPGVLAGRELAQRIGEWLPAVLAGSDNPTAEVLAALGDVIADAAAWRAYWDPREHAARVAAELEVQRELDAAEWAPVARQVRAEAQRMLTRR
jgi:type II secretory pathway component PulM